MFAVLDGKGKTLMLIIPNLLGMAHFVLTVLNQSDKRWVRGGVGHGHTVGSNLAARPRQHVCSICCPPGWLAGPHIIGDSVT